MEPISSLNFRSISCSDEFIRIFTILKDSRTEVQLWQKGVRKRYLSKATIKEFDGPGMVVEFLPRTQTLFDFEPDSPLYIHSFRRHIVFKTTIIFNSKSLMAVRPPDEMRCLETRDIERNILEQDLFASLNLPSENKKVTLARCRIIDISNSGVGFEVGVHEFQKFYVGDRLELDIDSHKIEGRLARVVYLGEYNRPKENLKMFRMGVELG